MTNNPRIYPRRAGQLNAIFTREEGERERETWMPSGMNARPRSSTSIPGPHLRRGAGMREEGDRSAVACATRITPLNISFISGLEQLPYSTNMRSARGTLAIALTYHALHPAVVAQPLLRETRRSGVVNETPLSFFLPSLLFSSPPSVLPAPSRSFPSPPPLLILFAHRFAADLDWTFCMPTERWRLVFLPIASCARRICGISRNAVRSCRERTISHPPARF